jgi:hypothetical protein
LNTLFASRYELLGITGIAGRPHKTDSLTHQLYCIPEEIDGATFYAYELPAKRAKTLRPSLKQFFTGQALSFKTLYTVPDFAGGSKEPLPEQLDTLLTKISPLSTMSVKKALIISMPKVASVFNLDNLYLF